jgi:hypothetical protein
VALAERRYESRLGGVFDIAFGWGLDILGTLVSCMAIMGALSLGFEIARVFDLPFAFDEAHRIC